MRSDFFFDFTYRYTYNPIILLFMKVITSNKISNKSSINIILSDDRQEYRFSDTVQ